MEHPVPSQSHPADQELWRIARRRVAFKRHLWTYIILNAALWTLWWFTDHRNADPNYTAIPWPIFLSLAWAVGLLMHFLRAYVFYSRRASIQKEYDKLRGGK